MGSQRAFNLKFKKEILGQLYDTKNVFANKFGEKWALMTQKQQYLYVNY
jgi:hypothetical protein